MSKISDLSDGGSLQSTDYLVAVRAGGNVKVQADDLTLDTLTVEGTLRVPNNEKLIFGTSSTELEVYYSSGPDVVLMDSPTAPLQLGASQVNIASYGGTNYAVFDSTGVDVTGTVTADGLTVSGTSAATFLDTNNTSGNVQQHLSLQRGNGSGVDGRINTAGDGSNGVSAIAFAIDGERMRVNSSGRVGIGTTTVNEKLVLGSADSGSNFLQITNSTTTAADDRGFYVGIDANEAARLLNRENTDMVFSTNNTTRMTLEAGGTLNLAGEISFGASTNKFTSSTNVLDGIGTNGVRLRAAISSAAAPSFSNSDDTNTGMFLPGSDVIGFSTGGSERARIDSSGNLLVGTTNNSPAGNNVAGAGLFPNGLAQFSRDGAKALLLNRQNTTGPIADFRKDSTIVGTITITSSTTSYNTSSDARLKENIADAEDAASLIDAIQVRSFDWIADGSHQRYGMVAQELLEVAPEAVSQGETEEDMMGVDYSKLVPMLVKEIQSLRARVAQLEGA